MWKRNFDPPYPPGGANPGGVSTPRGVWGLFVLEALWDVRWKRRGGGAGRGARVPGVPTGMPVSAPEKKVAYLGELRFFLFFFSRGGKFFALPPRRFFHLLFFHFFPRRRRKFWKMVNQKCSEWPKTPCSGGHSGASQIHKSRSKGCLGS